MRWTGSAPCRSDAASTDALRNPGPNLMTPVTGSSLQAGSPRHNKKRGGLRARADLPGILRIAALLRTLEGAVAHLEEPAAPATEP